MQTRISSRGTGQQDTAVSEILGAILLISVVVIAIAIVGVMLYSQSTPKDIPNVNFMVGTDNKNNLYLYHNGGDTLTLGSFSVIVDNARRDDYSVLNGGNQWSLGKNLVISNVPSATAHTVAVVYNQTGSGANVTIKSVSITNLTITNISTSPDVVAAATYPPMVSVTTLMQNITNKSVNYFREGGSWVGPGYIQFNVTDLNSSIVYSSGTLTALPLSIGSRVTIYQVATSRGLRIAGEGNQIWELTADSGVILNVENQSTTLSNATVIIDHTLITGYKTFSSTIPITTTGSPANYTSLILNNDINSTVATMFRNQIIGSASSAATSTKAVTISGIKPSGTGLFILNYNYVNRSVYFAGDASSITIS